LAHGERVWSDANRRFAQRLTLFKCRQRTSEEHRALSLPKSVVLEAILRASKYHDGAITYESACRVAVLVNSDWHNPPKLIKCELLEKLK